MTVNVTWPVPLNPLPNYTFITTFTDNACPIAGIQILGFVIDIGANVTISADSIYCPPGPQIKPLSVTANPGTFAWSPAAGLSCTNCQSPTATVSAPITYTVTYTDNATGCSAVASHQFRQHVMNLTTAPVSPVTWCTGNPGVAITARLNGDPGTTIVANPNRYDLSTTTFNAIAGGGWTAVTLSDDILSGSIPMGFNFTFYGTTYSAGFISSNGFFTFDGSASSGCCSGQAIPGAGSPNNFIAMVWNDLYPPGAGTVRYQTIGIAPNRRFVVQYNGIPRCCGTTPEVTTQLILFEGTNCIEIHTSQQTTTGTLTMGLENAAGTIGIAVPGRNATTWTVAAPEAYRFCPGNDTVGTGITYLWSPGGGVSNINAQNPTITPTSAPMNYTVTANDGICTAQRTVNFSCTLLGALCTDFNARFEGEQIALNWATTAEEDVADYALQRSIDGVHFEQVAWVAGKGNSPQGHAYTHNDNAGIARGIVYYYRIIAHDLNGDKNQICDVLSVATGENAISSVSIRPNPAHDVVEVTVHSTNSGEINIRIFDILGQEVCVKHNNPLQLGINAYQVDLHTLPMGSYFLRIGNDVFGYSTQRLTKVK